MAYPSGHVCSIVPPRLLEIALQHDDPSVREAAFRTLSVDHSIRTARVQNSLLGPRVPRQTRGARALVELYAGQPDRLIFDAKNTENPQGSELVRKEGQPPVSDTSVNEAYDGLGHTYDLFWKVYNRNSIDGVGMSLRGVVHYGKNYDNAFWDGQEMVFGDGDGQLFTGFTKSVDVIGHELSHGVTEHSLGLQYLGQSGALNESMSDVFGSLVKQYHLNETADQADWLIGEGILGPKLKGIALRSLKAPGTAYEGDDQPSHMKDYLKTAADNGGVHTNSGIPNHAFYLAATAIGGNAWRTGWIWYQALHDPRLTAQATFSEFAASTVFNASLLFGTRPDVVKAVSDAWGQVGVDLAALPPPPGGEI